MIKEARIYIPIEKSGIERLMPVAALHLQEDIYLIVAQPYDRLSEKWTFPPGHDGEMPQSCVFTPGGSRRH